MTSWRMPGDRPTLFNPFLLSLGVLRWQRVGWRQQGGRDQGGTEGEGRKEVGIRQRRESGGWEGRLGAPTQDSGVLRAPRGLCHLQDGAGAVFSFQGEAGVEESIQLKVPKQQPGQWETGWGKGERDGPRGALGLQNVSQTWA